MDSARLLLRERERDFLLERQHLDARIRCRIIGRWRLVRSDYSGVLCQGALDQLAPAAAVVAGDLATITFIDAARLQFIGSVAVPKFIRPHLMRPGAFIVAPDQMNAVQDYCRLLAQQNIIRLAFLNSELDLALLWLGSQIAARNSAARSIRIQ